MSIDPQNNHGVKRTNYQYQPDILGVVSTAPGFVAGAYTKDSYPIALIGRVPVKASTENGMIRIGDYLTASSVSGHAMKVSLAGRVLGKALENLDSAKLTDCPEDGYTNPKRKCGQVMMFVNLIDYLGTPVELAMGERNYESGIMNHGLVPSVIARSDNDEAISNEGIAMLTEFTSSKVKGFARNDENSNQQEILTFLRQLKDERASANAGYGSEIFTDRVSAVNEIITSHVITDLLTVKKIKADSIEGLEIITSQISKLKSQNDNLNLSTSSAGLSTSDELMPTSEVLRSDSSDGVVKFGHVEFENTTVKLDLTILGKLNANGGLVVLGSSEFKGDTVFERLVTFFSNVIFRGKVTFEEAPLFNKDAAGFAAIGKDTDEVNVVFEKEYQQRPLIIVGITLNTAQENFSEKNSDEQVQAQEALEKDMISYDLRYFVTKRDTKGFVIKLNKKAPVDVPFSWHAVAVADAKTFQSKAVPTPTPVPSLTPTLTSETATEASH